MATKKPAAENGEVKTKKPAAENGEVSAHYEEWRVEKKFSAPEDDKVTVTFEKLKLLRPVVKINEKEAEALNAGIASKSSSGILVLYMKPEQDINDYTFTYKVAK